MASRAGQKIKLTSIDELLCVPETEGTVDIDVRAIYPFEKHPFRVVDDEKAMLLKNALFRNPFRKGYLAFHIEWGIGIDDAILFHHAHLLNVR